MDRDNAAPPEPAPAPPTLRLPRFVLEEEIGLGSAVSRLAGAVGLRPCGGCAARARSMDRWVRFAPRG